jgi:hypothetical protein
MAETKEKLTASEKRAQKRREAAATAEAVFGTGRGSAEPVLNPLDYTASMMRALNYYNSAYENKDKRKWFMSYVGKKNEEFDSLPDYEFRSIGTLIRLKQRDQPLIDKDLGWIDSRIEEMRELAKKDRTVSALKGGAVAKVDKPVANIQDRMIEAASIHIGEINGLIDEFILNDTELNIAEYLRVYQVSAQVSKLIPAAFDKTIVELEEVIAGKDKDLVEGYSNFKKVKIKRLLAQIKTISDACAQQAVTAKAARKPTVRKVKVKPPAVIAKNVKYMKEFPELKITSVAPELLVESKEVWIYNTKYKKIQVYRAIGDGVMTVKGTCLIGYEVATSGAKTMRKPELVTGYVGMTKRTLGGEFKNLKTKESVVNGRINQECIILKVFK